MIRRPPSWPTAGEEDEAAPAAAADQDADQEAVRLIVGRFSRQLEPTARLMVGRYREAIADYRLAGADFLDRDVYLVSLDALQVTVGDLEHGREGVADQFSGVRSGAARRVHQDIALESFLHAVRLWGKVLWESVISSTRADVGAERGAALAIAGRILEHIDLVSVAAAQGYLEELQTVWSDREVIRRDLLDALISGDGDSEQVGRLARSLRLRLSQDYIVVVVRTAERRPEEIQRSLAQPPGLRQMVEAVRAQLLPAAGSLLMGVRHGEVIALYPFAHAAELGTVRRLCSGLADALESADARIGISSCHLGLPSLATSYAEAREAAEIAAGTGVHGRVVAFEDVLIDSIIRASGHADRILESTITPLLAYDAEHKAELVATLRCYVEAGFNLTKCAENRSVHPNTVVYRLRRIKELTGRDPHVPDDLLLLQLGLKLTGLICKLCKPARRSPRFLAYSRAGWRRTVCPMNTVHRRVGLGLLRRCAVPAVAACTALLSVACSSSAPGSSASGPVTIGVATTLSGPFATYGIGGLDGIRLAVQNIDSHGGLLGRQVKVATGDDQIDPATGETVTRNLILHDHVDALFGSVSSAVGAAQEQLAGQYKVPIFFHLANDVGLTTTTFNKYAFEFSPNTDMEPATAALYFAKVIGHKRARIATITPNYSFGLDTVSAFLADLKKDGVTYTLTDQQAPALGASSFTSQIAALLATSPQYVFAGQYGSDLVTLTKQGLGLGLFSKTVVGGMYDLQVLQALGAQAPAGAIAWDRDPFWTDDSSVMGNFVAAYKAAYHTYPSEFAIIGYSAVQAWAWAVKQAGSFDAGKVAATLGGATVPTIRGNVTIRSCDHQAEVAEWAGTIAAAPSPTYGTTLWGPDVLAAQPAQIIEPCS